MTRSRRPVAVLHRDGERRGLEDAEAAVRDEHRAAVERHVSPPVTSTRNAAANSGATRSASLRVEAERIDRIAAGEPAAQHGAGRTTPAARDAVDVEPSSCAALADASAVTPTCLPAGRDRDDVGPLEQLAQHLLRRDAGP